MSSVETRALSDEDLVRLYLESQSEAYFSALYKRYAAKVYGKCLTMLKESSDAEDALQDIFTKILLKLSAFEGKSRFSTWVYSITYNYCIDFLRKKGKRLFVDAEDMTQFDDKDQNDIEDKEILEVEVGRLKVVLNAMPVDDKAVLLMKYQDGMSIKEIGEVINKSESAVKMKIMRSKERFRRIYEETYTQRA